MSSKTTDECKLNGQLLSLFIQVDKCRPYFICMMGDRYGWSQQEKQKDDLLNESFTYASNSHQSLKWVDDYRFDTSVTKVLFD